MDEKLESEKEKRFKKECWDFALGVQKIDDYEPSEEYLALIQREINGEISTKEMIEILNRKYKAYEVKENWEIHMCMRIAM